MINIKPSSLSIKNPEYRSERVKNDLKYSWAMGTVGGLGAAAAIAAHERPDFYNRTKNFVNSQLNNLKATSFAKKAAEFFSNIKKSSIFTSIKSKIQPALTSLAGKLAGFKSELTKLGGSVSKLLAQVPTKYKIAAAVVAFTYLLLNNLSHKHAYNEGKIDGRYGK